MFTGWVSKSDDTFSRLKCVGRVLVELVDQELTADLTGELAGWLTDKGLLMWCQI